MVIPMHAEHDTITALATGPGEYGIAVIRLSGPLACAAVDGLVTRTTRQPDWTARRLYHGFVHDGSGDRVDEVMAVIFPGSATVTGEDCAEIHCHGGRLLVRRILDLLVASGLRLAEPGEFTRRAFFNGRIDLSRAEAVADLIHARSDTSRRLAMAQLEGGLFRTVQALRAEIIELLALIEAYVDFPDEEIGALDAEQLTVGASRLQREFTRLIDGYEQGRIVRDGASLLILGRPNVGKSSLLNVLVGEERAIVSAIPGTTRDTVEESIVLSGLPIRVIDTAGIRDSDDQIEAQGVERALAKLASADLVLLVYDAAAGFLAEDQALLSRCAGRPVLLVGNKADLPQGLAAPPAELPALAISCRIGSGLELLPERIAAILTPDVSGEVAAQALICDLRHKEALLQARAALVSFERLMQDEAPTELAACELRGALNALGEITGETTPDDILDRIFSRFCIGK